MRKSNPYPRIYEATPVGPPITYEDFIKTAASLRAVLSFVQQNFGANDKEGKETFKRLGRQLSAEIGKQWNMLTAMQYLTGQRADKAIHRWMPQFVQGGLSRARIEALVAVANDVCANASPGKQLAGGLLVEEYKRRPISPDVLLELMDLPQDVIDKVKENAAANAR